MSNVSEIFGTLVFNDHVMKERLPSETYKNLAKTIKEGKPLDIEAVSYTHLDVSKRQEEGHRPRSSQALFPER